MRYLPTTSKRDRMQEVSKPYAMATMAQTVCPGGLPAPTSFPVSAEHGWPRPSTQADRDAPSYNSAVPVRARSTDTADTGGTSFPIARVSVPAYRHPAQTQFWSVGSVFGSIAEADAAGGQYSRSFR